jgi:hypothetical protein
MEQEFGTKKGKQPAERPAAATRQFLTQNVADGGRGSFFR